MVECNFCSYILFCWLMQTAERRLSELQQQLQSEAAKLSRQEATVIALEQGLQESAQVGSTVWYVVDTGHCLR